MPRGLGAWFDGGGEWRGDAVTAGGGDDDEVCVGGVLASVIAWRGEWKEMSVL